MTTAEKLAVAEVALDATTAALKAAAGAGAAERFARHESVSAARERVTALKAELDAEVEAQAVRDAAEKAARKQLAAATAKLEASRRGLADAVEQARAALDAVHRRAEAHAALVDRCRGELAALGLAGETRPDGQPQSTGIQANGVLIDGWRWTRFAPAAVLAFAARHGVAAADKGLGDRLRGLDGVYAPQIAADLGIGRIPRSDKGVR